MLVFLDVGEYVDLVDGTFLQLFIFLKPPNLNNLDSILLIIQFINGPINLTIGPLPYNLIKRIVLNNSHHLRSVNNYYTPHNHLFPSLLSNNTSRKKGVKYYF